MAGKTSKQFCDAMRLVLTGETAYSAAKRIGLHPGTLYRSPIYKAWRDDQPNEYLSKLKEELRTIKLSRGKR